MDHPVMATRSSDGLRNSLADTREPGRELVSSERVWSGPIFAVDADQVRLGPGQEPVARQVVVHHDAVAVVALREGEASSQADGAAVPPSRARLPVGDPRGTARRGRGGAGRRRRPRAR